MTLRIATVTDAAHRHFILVLLILSVFLGVGPVSAQNDPQPPAATVQTQDDPSAETTSDVTPATLSVPGNQSEFFTLTLSLIEKIGYIIAFYFLFKSIPADKVKEVFESAAASAKKTETPVDDFAITIGRMIAEALNRTQSEAPPQSGGPTPGWGPGGGGGGGINTGTGLSPAVTSAVTGAHEVPLPIGKTLGVTAESAG